MYSIPWTAIESASAAIPLVGLGLLTLARPWFRDHVYKLLRGDPEKHRNFVLDGLKASESQGAVAELVLDSIADPRYADRHRAIVAEQWKEDIQHLKSLAESTASTTTQLAASTNSLVLATERLVTVTDEIARKTQATAERVARLEGAKGE